MPNGLRFRSEFKASTAWLMGLEVAPDDLDVVEFGGVFRQPLDGEPMGALGERGRACLADVDRAVVEHHDDRLDGRPGLRAVEAVEGLQMRDEVGAALGREVVTMSWRVTSIERAHHGDLLGLPGRRHAQVRAALGPGAGEIGMRQRFALIAVEQHDVAGLGLRLAQLEPQSDAIDGVGILTALQRVPGPPPAETLFLRSTLDSCERVIVTPRALRSPGKAGDRPVGRSATGAERRAGDLSAAAAFTGAGPGATLAFSASTPPLMKSLRHSRTVSSRTPKASAICALVQPPASTARPAPGRPRLDLRRPP